MRKVMLFCLSLAALSASGCIVIGNRGNEPVGGAVAHKVESPASKDIVLEQNGGGIVLKNEGGQAYRITVGPEGQVVSTPVL